MIRDYNFAVKPRRRKRRSLAPILIGITAIGLAVGVVRFVDLGDWSTGQAHASEQTATDTVSIPLALPQPGAHMIGASADEVLANEQHAEPQAVIRHQQLALPAKAATAPAAVTQSATDDAAQISPSLLHASLAAPHGETHGVEDAITEPPSTVVETFEEPKTFWIDHTVDKGESLARIFAAQEIEPRVLHRIVNSSKEAKALAHIRPGQKLRFEFDENHELTRLELHRNRVESMRVAISDDEVRVEEVSKDVEKRVASASGQIESSLFVDGQKAGLSDGQIMDLATIFGWDIDFALEIRAGDQFRVLYEEHYLDGEKLRDGAILAAEFTNRGTTHRAIRYEDRNGDVGYFDADGNSKRRAFIRTPIKFARVSSRYNPRRWHPVLKKWRSHKGVDYAAPRGTPVKATGDGRVIFRGTKGGYGKTVIVEHASKYTTLYAHLSGYSKRSAKGKRVKQGQVIGYVGKTGLATGPHLHYEFRVRGQHRDPLRVKLPKSLGLPKSEIADFRSATAPLLAQLESIPTTLVASAEASQNP